MSLLGSIMGEISSTLPIHGLAGAGTYEAGVLVALLPAGVGLDEALNGAVNLHLFVLGATILSAAIALGWGSLSGSPDRRPTEAERVRQEENGTTAS